MGVFGQFARPVILAAAKQDGLRRAAERVPLTRRVVHRFVPGEGARRRDDGDCGAAGFVAAGVDRLPR